VEDAAGAESLLRDKEAHAARVMDQGGEARVEIALIKFWGARMLHNVIDRAIQVHGARGLTDETPLAAMSMMARGARIYDGPDEVHRMVVARRILRSYRDGEGWAFS
jgi:alkylation response protein AidB-like acyl-CoA dehydrogenase